jgi:hypothetical protein
MQDRRAHLRHGVRIEGKLMSPDMSFCVDVVVRNLSEDGALINALAPVHMVPGRVYLWQARTRTLFECEVQWRKNDRLLGLRFTETSNRLSVLNLLESASALQSRPSAPSLPMRCAS